MRVAATALVGLTVGALAVACSSGNAAPPAADAGNTLAAYVECLRANGVTLPSRSPGAFPSRSGFPGRSPGAFGSRTPRPRPSGSPRASGFGGGGFGGGFGFGSQPPAGVDQATWDKARQACAAKLSTAGPGGGGVDRSALAAYRSCLADHGITFTPGQTLSTADPKVAAALRACAPLRPTPRPTPSPTPHA
jgi:hypothetical protein